MLAVIVLLLTLLLAYCYGINRLLGLPPGPPPLPLIGNLLSYRMEMDKTFLEWKARYGRIFTVWLPLPMIVVGDHTLLQEHIVKDGNTFLFKKNPVELMKLWFGGTYGLIFEDNNMIVEQRRFALRSLHEVGFGSAALEDNVHNCALEIVERWRGSGGAVIDVADNISKAVGNIVWNITFGILLDFDNEIVPTFREFQREIFSLMCGPLMMVFEALPWICKFDFLFGGHFARMRKLLADNKKMMDDTLAVVNENYDADSQPRSYAESFIREMRTNEEAGKPQGNFHYQQLTAAVQSIWGAGFDTTIGTTRLCCLELVNHPDVQRKVQAEIDEIVGKRRICYEDQKLLPYTCAFIQEIYRIGFVLPLNFAKTTTQATEIEGWHIAAGTTILPQYEMVHMDPAEFERPELFCPERHIGDDGKFIKDPRITPFSVGKRSCIGESLARMEVFVLFTTFVQNCTFLPANKVPPPVEFDDGFTRIVKDFLVRVEPRN